MKTKMLALLAMSTLFLAACTQQQLDTAVETNEKANELLESTIQKAEDFEQSVEDTTNAVGESVEQGIQDSFIGDGINNVNGIVDNMNETEQEIDALLGEDSE